MEATHCNHDITFPSWSYYTSAHVFRNSDALREAELLQVEAFFAQCDDDGYVSINNEASLISKTSSLRLYFVQKGSDMA